MDIRKSWLVAAPIAHRGLHNAEIPENSLEAFENAVKNDYAIELDVRIIDDGNIIVFHDDALCRMTNQDGYASNLKTEELAALRLQNTDSIIPTFEQTLELVNGRVPLLVEIKNQNKVGNLESKLLSMLSAYNGEYAVQSFNPFCMQYFKENAPQILRGQLAAMFTKQDIKSVVRRTLLKKLKLNNVSCPDFISYSAADLPNKYVTKTGLPVLAWTIRSNAEMEKVLPHCDNIIFEKFIPSKAEQ